MTSLDEIAYEAIRPAYAENCVSARFVPKAEITISWIRTRTEIEFAVSDYLEGAPEEVIGDLIRWTHRRISGDDDAVPGERAAEYLLSGDFRAKALPVWLERHGAWISGSDESAGITIGIYPGETMKCAALLNAVLLPEGWTATDPEPINMEIEIARRYIREGREGFAAGIRPDMDKIREEIRGSAGILTD